MFYNLLEGESTLFASWQFWVIVAVLVLFFAYSIWSNKKRRKQMEEEQAKRNDIHPGYLITTIGGIMGVVESVDEEANTFILKTGTFENPNYIKFDKQAIYTSENPNPVEETVEETVEKPEENEVAELAREQEGDQKETSADDFSDGKDL